jgi:hypothetical protein
MRKNHMFLLIFFMVSLWCDIMHIIRFLMLKGSFWYTLHVCIHCIFLFLTFEKWLVFDRVNNEEKSHILLIFFYGFNLVWYNAYHQIPYAERKLLVYITCLYVVYFSFLNLKSYWFLTAWILGKNHLLLLIFLYALTLVEYGAYQQLRLAERKLLIRITC